MGAASEARARAAIERLGLLLVYPIENRSEPPSLWSALHPRTPMRWAWDEGADDRVVSLWHLRERLAASRSVVYGKWFRDRAVFFSRELFAAMLAHVRQRPPPLSREARELLSLLEDDSPQSTKRLRREAGLVGREHERLWTQAMRELWRQLLVVGTGEVDDGAFPSLEVGATRWIFEDLWEAARAAPTSEQRELLAQHLPPTSAFGKHWRKLTLRAARDEVAGFSEGR
jgi:hypothetical protein